METITQLRAVCPACFATQATRGGRLVQHGYRRPQHWNQNVGVCSGAGEMHFGTEAGRDYAADLAVRLRAQADRREADAVEVENGRAQVLATKRVARGVVSEVVVENPTELERRDYARTLRSRAGHDRLAAVEYEKAVADWKPVEPVAVEVEAKSGPLVHWSGGYWKNGKACAGSAMGAMKGFATRDLAHVTCEKCKAIAAKKGAA